MGDNTILREKVRRHVCLKKSHYRNLSLAENTNYLNFYANIEKYQFFYVFLRSDFIIKRKKPKVRVNPLIVGSLAVLPTVAWGTVITHIILSP